MSWLDRLTGFLKREAADIADMADSAKDRLDEELTRREAELAKTPSEKIQDLQRDSEQTADRFDEITEKAQARAHRADAGAEVESGLTEPEPAAQPESKADPDAGGTEPTTDPDAQVAADAGADGDPGDPNTERCDSARDLAEAIASDPETPTSPDPDPERFQKSDAQVRYEQARAKADDLLDELRGELHADGDI